uniref:FGENESH: predicted gene_3.283 protein n=1 Tax=Rhodotorula toruloides TaxID=5286 RepID=A0A0K3CFI8_RHOTO
MLGGRRDQGWGDRKPRMNREPGPSSSSNYSYGPMRFAHEPPPPVPPVPDAYRRPSLLDRLDRPLPSSPYTRPPPTRSTSPPPHRPPSFVNGVPIPASLPRRPGHQPPSASSRTASPDRRKACLPSSTAELRERERTTTPPLPPRSVPLSKPGSDVEEGELPDEDGEVEELEGEVQELRRDSIVEIEPERQERQASTPPPRDRPPPSETPEPMAVQAVDDVDMFAPAEVLEEVAKREAEEAVGRTPPVDRTVHEEGTPPLSDEPAKPVSPAQAATVNVLARSPPPEPAVSASPQMQVEKEEGEVSPVKPRTTVAPVPDAPLLQSPPAPAAPFVSTSFAPAPAEEPKPSPSAAQRPLPPPPPPPYVPPTASSPTLPATAPLATPAAVSPTVVPPTTILAFTPPAPIASILSPIDRPTRPSPTSALSPPPKKAEEAPLPSLPIAAQPVRIVDAAPAPTVAVVAPEPVPAVAAAELEAKVETAVEPSSVQQAAAPISQEAKGVSPAVQAESVTVALGLAKDRMEVGEEAIVQTAGASPAGVVLEEGLVAQAQDVLMKDGDAIDSPRSPADEARSFPKPPSPHLTDDQHRHSPTTPPGRSPEGFDSVLHTVIRENEDEAADAEAVVEANRKRTLEERLRLTGGVTIPPLMDRDELFVKTWESVNEPHTRLSQALFASFESRDERRKDKAIALRQQYKLFNADWKAHCARLDKLRERVHRPNGQNNAASTAPQTPSIDSSGMPFYPEPTTPGPSLVGGRANRRSAGAAVGAFGYGDAVRSEAEFLEILASLETADLRDPDVRAARTAAVVPDMVIDDSERRELLSTAFEDERYRVVDPEATFGVNAPLDLWTEQEVETFCKRYAQHPKQFGKIAQDLPDKTTAQCVLFYYRMKHTIDFRSLSDRRGRDGRRKKSKKRPEGKGSFLLSNLNKKARSAAPPIDERDEDEDEVSAPTSPRMSRSELPTPVDDHPHGEGDRFLVTSRGHPAEDADGDATMTPAPKRPAKARQTPKGAALDLPSEGMMEAAEVLGALAGDPGEDAGGAGSTAQGAGSTGRSGAGRPRKLRVDVDSLPTEEVIGDSPVGPDGDADFGPGDKAKPKRKSTTSSYWTVAERAEILKLLAIHGKDWKKLAEGLGNKTWIQCRNWYQNNAKKHNLADIVNNGGTDTATAPAPANVRENIGPQARSTMPRAGFFEDPAQRRLPPLPSLEPSRRAGSSGPSGMHLSNMLNDDGPGVDAGSPARDDWFGNDAAEASNATTEDGVDRTHRMSAFQRFDPRQSDARPASAPHAVETAAQPEPSAQPALHRAPLLPSFPSSLDDRRFDAARRIPALSAHSWTPHSPASSFAAYSVSPAASASPMTPALPTFASDGQQRRTSAPSDYFSVKLPERYARSAEPLTNGISHLSPFPTHRVGSPLSNSVVPTHHSSQSVPPQWDPTLLQVVQLEYVVSL